MTIDEVENYFGTMSKCCSQLSITIQNVTQWRRQGYIPLLQQYRIAELTEGELMPDDIDPKTIKKEVAQ